MKGYSDFKIKFASELNSLILNEKRIEINMPFEQNIKEDDIPKRFYQMYHQVIDDVYHSLDIQQLKNIAHLLYHSDAITVYGVGSSLLIAQDFVMKCQKLRLPIYCNTQIGLKMSIVLKHLKILLLLLSVITLRVQELKIGYLKIFI